MRKSKTEHQVLTRGVQEMAEGRAPDSLGGPSGSGAGRGVCYSLGSACSGGGASGGAWCFRQ